jgi:amino acid permease
MSLPSLRLREFPERGFAVWYAVSAPIAAWAVHLTALAALVEYSYDHRGGTFWMHLITGITGTVTVVAMVLSYLMIRRAGATEDEPSRGGRIRFLGELGLVIGIVNLALIVLEEIYLDVLHGRTPHG